MKWLYIIFGILGGLVPAAYIFSRVSSNRLLSEPDLVLFSLGIGIIVTPLFMCIGIVIARIAELCLGFLRSTKRGSRHIPDWPEGQPGNGSSWVARRLQNYSAKRSLPDKEDTDWTGAQGLSNGERQP